MAIAQNICFKYQKQGIVDVLLELNKALTGQRMDEWIQLFNVETVDDLKAEPLLKTDYGKYLVEVANGL